MDVSLLKPDEINVECELRGIISDSPNAMSDLLAQIEAEHSKIAIAPAKMHERAYKRPDNEIECCRTKLLRLKEEVAECSNVPSDQLGKKVRQIVSRLLHVRGRLERATQSPSYQKSADQVLKSCQQLLDSLAIYINDDDLLDESLEKAAQVEIGTVPELSVKTSIVFEPSKDVQIGMVVTESGSSSSSLVVPSRLNTNPQHEKSSLVSSGTTNTKIVSQPTQVPAHDSVMTAILAQLQQVSSQMTSLTQRQDDLQSQLLIKKLPTYGQASALPPPVSIVETASTASKSHNPPVNQVQFPLNLPTYNRPVSSIVYTNVGTNIPNTQQMPNLSTEPITSFYNPTWIPPTTPLHTSTLSASFVHPSKTTTVYPPTQPPLNVSANTYSSDRRSFARCGINYSGSPTGITVDMFLFQLDSVIASYRLPSEILLLDLHLLLKDVALQWYWIYRRHNPQASWTEL